MNKQIEEFARNTLKEGLSQCTDKHQHTFKRMYSPSNTELDINTVVDNMPCENLDWAMSQVSNTLKKRTQSNAT